MQQILDNQASAIIPAIAMTDGELLMQYARHGDEAAFATLVEKHGRLVWTVCWQVLRQHHEIEDAFQSTFFILAKRASSIRSCDSLCGWLYRVAYRTALRARLTAKRRPLTELAADEVGDIDDKLKAIEQHEQRAVLIEELHALPVQYQQALILCYLEGKPRRKIAEELGISMEAVKGRLARGRQVLRHRLIRRGVSLSLAMGAMAVPVKAASVAVTPQLAGLTTTGAAAWAAGSAKISTTVSSQVIHLAHQGTIAMTVSSFAKPLVLGVALLGAVSGTLAVDSTDQSSEGKGSAIIDLQAGDDGQPAGDPTSVGDGAEVQLVPAEIEAPEASKAAPAITFIEGKGVTIADSPPQPPRNRMELRGPVTAAPADVLVSPPIPTAPVVQHLDVRLAEPVDLKLKLKVAALETKVSQLQLESKKLEIAAFDAKGEEKERLMKGAHKKLLMAEAEKLQMEIARQQAQIEALEKVIKEQAEGLGKQAAEMGRTIDVDISQDQARLYEEQAEAAAAAQAAKVAQFAAKARAAEAATTYPSHPPVDPNAALSLQPGDEIKIEADGAFPDRPIDGVYVIEPMGTVALGARYGRVEVVGLSVLDAEKEIRRHLDTILEDVEVQVTFVARRPANFDIYVPSQNIPSDPQSAEKR